MNIREVKRNLNRRVKFRDPMLYPEGTEYLFTGCILRSDGKGFYYQAELLDISHGNSVLICRLENIEEIRA